MIDDNKLNKLVKEYDFRPLDFTSHNQQLELIRLARLGLWAENHGAPLLKVLRRNLTNCEEGRWVEEVIAHFPKEKK